ncbi:MAG TPA: hypothetical protein VFV81_05840, partial [Verrucomicrobiae bacterium]|nr:hypothetical protein [Verrucomicrobiae bacterium]
MKYIGNAFHCRRRVLNRVKCLAAVAVLLALCASQAGASGIIYQFNNVFSGSSLSQPAPWLDATFQDVNGGVELTISNASLTSGEFVSGFYFNLNTNLNPSSLDFTLLNKSAGVATPTISQGANQFKADGDGYYDVLFSFDTGHSGRFGAGDSISFFICGITNLNAYDFTFLSSAGGGKGPFY